MPNPESVSRLAESFPSYTERKRRQRTRSFFERILANFAISAFCVRQCDWFERLHRGAGGCRLRAFGPPSEGVTTMSRRSLLSVLALLAGVTAVISGQGGGARMPSLASGDWPHYTADMRGTQLLAARSDQRLATSTSSRSRGASRPTASARVPSTSSKARRWRSTACSTRPAARAARSSRSTARPAS